MKKQELTKKLKNLAGEEFVAQVTALLNEGEQIPPSALKRLNEYYRVVKMREFDLEKAQIVAGVDEAGRGPLAGHVYAASVILPPNIIIEGLNDSKKISEKKREELFEIIKEKALAFSIAFKDSQTITNINIRNATLLAMKNAVEGLKITPQKVLVDGNALPEIALPAEYVIKGDSKSMTIAAASILAKVTRDRYIKEMDEIYPQYGFAKHKGYGTAEHIEAIKKYGPCPIHRKDFIKNFL